MPKISANEKRQKKLRKVSFFFQTINGVKELGMDRQSILQDFRTNCRKIGKYWQEKMENFRVQLFEF